MSIIARCARPHWARSMNGLLYVEPLTERRMEVSINREIWGWAVYKRQLTPEEIADYELIEKLQEGQR